MGEESSIRSTIMRYYDDDECRNPNGRHRSWEYCYDFFGEFLDESDPSPARSELATLHLAFFLASWGMYRGSAFALKTTYKFHEGAVEIVRRYKSLRGISMEDIVRRAEEVKALCRDLKNCYLDACKRYYDGTNNSSPNFDLLVGKVILGTLCCAPAFDVYFCAGLKSCVGDFPFNLDKRIDTVAAWISTTNIQNELSGFRISSFSGRCYPNIKLIDMYFWQRGRDIERSSTSKEALQKSERPLP